MQAPALRIDERFVGFTSALKFNRRRASADIWMVTPGQRAKRAANRLRVSILRNAEHDVVVHREASPYRLHSTLALYPQRFVSRSRLQPVANSPGEQWERSSSGDRAARNAG